MTWETTINNKKRVISATLTSSLMYNLSIKLDGGAIGTYKGAEALKTQIFNVDGIVCSIKVVPDFFKPIIVLTVNNEYIGTTLQDADEQSKLGTLKIVIGLLIITFIMQTVLAVKENILATPKGILIITEPLFAITTILGFMETRHPFFGKLLRIYFGASSLFYVYSIFDGKAGTMGGALTPFVFLMVSIAVTGLQRYPKPRQA